MNVAANGWVRRGVSELAKEAMESAGLPFASWFASRWGHVSALRAATSLGLVAGALALIGPCPAQAQAPARIFRCGNTYTNDPVQAQAAGCRPVQGSPVTVVEGTRVQAPSAAPAAAASPGPSSATPAVNPAGQRPEARIDSREQQARDAQAREILEEELRRAQLRQAELQREYNNGEPEKLGPETRNHQKYLDRIEQLKASLARNESDIQGLRRELARLGASK